MLKVEASSFKNALEMIEVLTLPANVKRRLLARIGRMAIAQAQKNVRDQKTVDGTAMTPRKDGSGLDMFHYLYRSKWIGLKVADEQAKVFFPSKASTRKEGKIAAQGYVAAKHHHGADEVWKMEKKMQLYPRSAWFKLCNDAQALDLIRCGYGKPKSQIMKSVTVGDAINWLNAHKDSWVIRVAPRPVLGANQEVRKLWGDKLMGDIRERFRAKNYADLLT